MSQSTALHVAAQVRAEMARKQITAQQLAAELDVSEMWVSRRLRGQVEFTVSELIRAAEALGVPATQLMPPTPASAVA